MTLEEDEGIDLNPALPASGRQAGSEKQSSANVQLVLTRCAEIAAVIPIIILLLPVYMLIQVYAATVCIYRILRGIHRRVLIRDVCIPDVCSASQNLRVR